MGQTHEKLARAMASTGDPNINQAHDRYETLKKETSRRKSIHDELEAAFIEGGDNSIPAKVQEFNQIMIGHFNLPSADKISNKQLSWLAMQLSQARQDKRGRSFQERSAQAAIRAESRKRKAALPAQAALPDGSIGLEPLD